jgi:hypothetical protein
MIAIHVELEFVLLTGQILKLHEKTGLNVGKIILNGLQLITLLIK